MAKEYVFQDEWDVDAPQQTVFDALADARTYLKTTSEIVSFDPPKGFSVKVVGDLTGSGVWTLTPRDGKVHVRFDWTVFADRPLLRYLTPILRPVFRYNHNWSVKRAIEGLEPYARSKGG